MAASSIFHSAIWKSRTMPGTRHRKPAATTKRDFLQERPMIRQITGVRKILVEILCGLLQGFSRLDSRIKPQSVRDFGQCSFLTFRNTQIVLVRPAVDGS